MWHQFFLENSYFAVNVLLSLILFSIAWLYLDAWTLRKTFREGTRVVGILLLSLSYLVQAVVVEHVILPSSIIDSEISALLIAVFRIGGYLLFILSLIIEPLQPRPKISTENANAILPLYISQYVANVRYSFPVLALIVSFMYLRRASWGLERHLYKVALGFFLLSISEVLSLSTFLRGTENTDIYKLVQPFGLIWILQLVVQFLSALVLGKWVFAYLLKRIQTQLFMIFTFMVLIIFLLTTVSFTALLTRNLQNQALKEVETEVKVIDYSIKNLQQKSLSDAQMIAANPQIIEVVKEKKSAEVAQLSEGFLINKNHTILTIFDDAGVVLGRGDEKERRGDSLTKDPLVQRALLGNEASTISTADGVVSQQVTVKAVTPIKDKDEVIGGVIVGQLIDNAFTDNLKKSTGLESLIFSSDQISASGINLGNTSLIGIKEHNKEVVQTVLTKGENYVAPVNLLNVPYVGAYMPLKDMDETPVGMLFVGKPQVTILQTAGKSIELTFIITAAMLAFSILPAALLAKYLSRQLE